MEDFDEFELAYADELELLREQEDCEIDQYAPTTTRQSPVHRASKRLSFDEIQHETEPEKENFTPNTQTTIPIASNSEAVASTTHNSEENATTAKKRTIEELFGDIDDLLGDNPEYSLSKKKKGLPTEIELIERILEMRKLAKEQCNVSVIYRNESGCSKSYNADNLSYRVPKYPFVGVTRHDGTRVYVKCHSEQYEEEELKAITKDFKFGGIMGEAFKEAWKTAEHRINQNFDDQEKSANAAEPEPTTTENQFLWVDLYKPKRYIELLSDESTNRMLLSWIKLWDKAVFNRRPKKKFPKLGVIKKTNFQKQMEMKLELSADGRPKYKVVLLCGPPGLGKTTLAHMIARHAGYNVVEINASDDRSTESFKTALENATQMKSVLDREKRPNCLVFDEIDGAPAASIEFLIKFINDTVKPKKGQKANVLKRPIICICNDVYVPALRNLRQMALVINFPPTASARLAERLSDIAKHQRIKTNMGALLMLAEKTQNDIRACLSVLHFFKSLNKPVTLSEINRASIGQKDVQKGLFDVWRDIFYIKRPKFKMETNNDGDGKRLYKDTSRASRMNKVLSTVTSFGDYDRLMQGVFENYPYLEYKDHTLRGTADSTEWFCFNDIVNKTIHTTQNYSLSTYLQYGFVVWHFVFGSLNWQKLQYPSKDYEVRTKKVKYDAIVQEVLKGLPSSKRAYVTAQALRLDILPMIMKIIVPRLRPVNFHIFTKDEKEEVARVVDIMIDYNLNYVQERTPDGIYVYNMDPPVDDLTRFETGEPKKPLSYAHKQLLTQEIEQGKMRKKKGEEEKQVPTESQKPKIVEKAQPKTSVDIEKLPNHLQTLQAKEVKKTTNKPVAIRDFFTVIKPSAKSIAQEEKSKEDLATSDIWFRYKQGYSNAVRRPIKISELLQ